MEQYAFAIALYLAFRDGLTYAIWLYKPYNMRNNRPHESKVIKQDQRGVGIGGH